MHEQYSNSGRTGCKGFQAIVCVCVCVCVDSLCAVVRRDLAAAVSPARPCVNDPLSGRHRRQPADDRHRRRQRRIPRRA